MGRPPHLPPVSARFKKGVSGNPSGKPKNLLTTDLLKKKISQTLAMTKDEIESVIADKKSTALELILATVIKRAMKDGDINRAEQLFVRSIGKVKDTMELVRPEPVIIKRADGTTLELGTAEVREDEETV